MCKKTKRTNISNKKLYATNKNIIAFSVFISFAFPAIKATAAAAPNSPTLSPPVKITVRAAATQELSLPQPLPSTPAALTAPKSHSKPALHDDLCDNATINFDTLPSAKIANFLGWVSDDNITATVCPSSSPHTAARHAAAPPPRTTAAPCANTNTPNKNLCHGHYAEPPIVTQHPQPVAPDKVPTTITATKSALFSQDGNSVLVGDVNITQPGRQITADKVTLYRSATTGQISSSTFVGKVNLREYGKIIVAKDGHWDIKLKLITLHNSVYRILRPIGSGGAVDAWGKARTIVRNDAGVLKLKQATYTTCSPANPSWVLWGSKTTLDKEAGRGTITNALLLVKNHPVFYLPYLSFPIDKRRKSGFLYPSLSYSGSSGLDTAVPYYLNLAPNYDALITPRIINQRGLLGQGLFRYLTPSSSGALDIRYIPSDNQFASFQKNSASKYKDNSSASYSLSRLTNANTSRGFFSYQNKTNINQHWSSTINLNYVTDDYFIQDFGDFSTINKDQLFNQADVSYAGETWRFSALMQAFQTLYPINQSPTAQGQYRRLPQLDLKGDFPDKKYGLDYQLSSQFVNFDYDHTYDPITKLPKASGSRINITPTISLPLRAAGSYFTPQVQLHTTLYSLKNNQVAPYLPPGSTPPGTMENSIQRAVPIISADSGLFLNRSANLFGNSYTQTLEPRFFYLFVPRNNQSNIPIFDTSLSAFNFDQLFATNRFSGYDLVGDANQASIAVTTRFLDAQTAEEKFSASIGQMYAFNKHTVWINRNCSSDPLAQHRISPTVAQLQYNLTANWSASANAAWDANVNRFNNGAVSINYNRDNNKIASLGYNFIKDGDYAATTAPTNGSAKQSNNLNRINLAVAWPIKENWSVVGNWNYNISHDHPQEYFYGVEYQNCCWAVRIVHGRAFIGTDPKNINNFKETIYLQFMLKGLSSIGTSNAGGILTSKIPGYKDNFSGLGAI